jgi:hypothetical protein
VARPRFGFSVFGIGCVITAIAFFGAKPLFVPTATGFWPIALVVLLAAATSFAVLRDWRRCLAVLLSAASAIQIAIWPVARAGAALTSTTAVDSLTVVSIIFVLQLFQAQEASGAIATEDDAVAGFERAIETRAMAVCVAGAVGIAALLPFSGRDLTTWGCCAVGILAGVASAVLFQPAIAITVESLVPRAATIAGRYRL